MENKKGSYSNFIRNSRCVKSCCREFLLDFQNTYKARPGRNYLWEKKLWPELV